MSACEKCWRDAHRDPQSSVTEEYMRLLDTRRIRQIEVRFWFGDQDPVHDEPREAACVWQPTLEETLAGAMELIRRHYVGVCGCQSEEEPDPHG